MAGHAEHREACALIVRAAKSHDDRYLLPRRTWVGSNPDADALYDACHSLIAGGYARWMSGNLAPGIRLTGKPYGRI